jgi:thioredoxin reductase (NADPH)
MPDDEAPDDAEVLANPFLTSRFDAEVLEELLAFGDLLEVQPGELLFDVDEPVRTFFVVVEGEVDVVRAGETDEEVVARHGAGGFLGELNLITGQRTYLRARVAEAGRVIAIGHDSLRRLMATKPDISDTITRTLAARRQLLRHTGAAGAIRIVGSRYSPESLALRAYALRQTVPHRWVELEELEDAPVYLAGLGARPADLPVVVLPTVTLHRATPGEFADLLGLTYRPVPGSVTDLVVVGGGPAGLAAAVYGASEGLDTLCLDSVAIGGQAGASSRIENFVGFPNGISGGELTQRAYFQAQRLGARVNAPCVVDHLREDEGFLAVVLRDGSEIPARAVIAATGASYRRLGARNLERFDGAGVFYAATEMEARLCRGSTVAVVGAGNSAGQAALYMAKEAGHVLLVVRGDDLAKSMSHYLVARIEADPRIEVMLRSEIRSLDGERQLETIAIEDTSTGDTRTVPCGGVFCFIGAQPATEWLAACVKLDDKGFVLTDRALPPDAISPEHFAGRDPLPFETSHPGVFAVGDIRSGSMKRVAAAVGEGSSAVRSVHDFLALHA